MARIVITRPNGETEYAELTTDKNLAGNDRLMVEKAGTTYYAKLDSGVSTHMYVIKPDGRKLYVQKEIKFTWKYEVDDSHPIAGFVIPRTGKYKLKMLDGRVPARGRKPIEEINDYLYNFKKDTKPNKNEYDNLIIIEMTENKDVYLEYDYYIDEDDPDSRYIKQEYTSMKSIEYIGEA